MTKDSADVSRVLGRESANLIGLPRVAKGSADVPCFLGRESANLIGLEGVAKGSADVPCDLGRESANVIGLEGVTNGGADVHCGLGGESANLIGPAGVAKGAADVPCVPRRESANLIGLEGAPKVIRNELGARYNEMKRIDHIGTDRVGVGGAEQESRKILAESATDVAKLAELFNHRISITNTALDSTKNGLREAQRRGTEKAPLLKWKETMQMVLKGRIDVWRDNTQLCPTMG